MTSFRIIVCVVVIRAAVILALALLAAGCGSSGQSPGESGEAELRLAVDDLRPLVTVSPEATGWTWQVDPQTRLASPPFKLDQSDRSYPIQKALTDAYQNAGLTRSATSSWFDGAKKASSFANLVATPAGATAALAAERTFAGAWFPEFEHQEIRDIGADGIGEQRWAVRSGTDNAGPGFVEIGWTRANVVLAVYVSCNPCDSDVADAARRWAATIDDAAHKAAD